MIVSEEMRKKFMMYTQEGPYIRLKKTERIRKQSTFHFRFPGKSCKIPENNIRKLHLTFEAVLLDSAASHDF